jgi:hypothetical protein
VTEVLAPWSDFSRVRPDVLEAAAERGTIVHTACSALATGVWFPPLPEGCRGYVESFQRWFDAAVEKVLMVEPNLVHPVYRYVGHPDMIVRIKGDATDSLIDIKTPLALSKSWRLQLAAYYFLTHEHPCGRVLIVRLRKTGAPPVVTEHTGTLVADFSIFLACLTAGKFFKGDNRHA